MKELWVLGFFGLGVATPAAGQRAAHEGLERLKSLAGEWWAPGPDGDSVRVSYQIVSGGTAVLERVLGAEHGPAGMVSIFYLDRDRLAMSHFCTAGNQPRFESPGLAGERLTFELVAGSLRDPGQGHIHRVGFRFASGDRVESSWEWVEGGAGDHRLIRRQTRVTR